MARKINTDGLDLETLSGRLAFAIKTSGPTFVANNTSLSIAQVNRLSNEKASTTLENAAAIAQATGFELKWIALGDGPMKIDDDLWEHTNSFKKIEPLDEAQKINMSFEPDFLSKSLGVEVEDCRIWEIDYKANLKGLERGYTVLVDIRKSERSGLILVETNGQKRIVETLSNMDGSVSITMDNDILQNLTAEQFNDLNILGSVIWQGGQS